MKLKSLKNAEHRNSSHLELDATDEEAAQGEKKGCWVRVWVVGISWRATTHCCIEEAPQTQMKSVVVRWKCFGFVLNPQTFPFPASGEGLDCGLWMPPRSSFVRISLHPESRQHHTMHCWLRAIATNIAWENICSYQHSLIKGEKKQYRQYENISIRWIQGRVMIGRRICSLERQGWYGNQSGMPKQAELNIITPILYWRVVCTL